MFCLYPNKLQATAEYIALANLRFVKEELQRTNADAKDNDVETVR